MNRAISGLLALALAAVVATSGATAATTSTLSAAGRPATLASSQSLKTPDGPGCSWSRNWRSWFRDCQRKDWYSATRARITSTDDTVAVAAATALLAPNLRGASYTYRDNAEDALTQDFFNGDYDTRACAQLALMKYADNLARKAQLVGDLNFMLDVSKRVAKLAPTSVSSAMAQSLERYKGVAAVANRLSGTLSALVTVNGLVNCEKA